MEGHSEATIEDSDGLKANVAGLHLFAEFLQRFLQLHFGPVQLADGRLQHLPLLLHALQTLAQLVLLLVHFGSFSLGLVQLTSQRSGLGVQRELRLRALRGVRLQLSLRRAWRW